MIKYILVSILLLSTVGCKENIIGPKAPVINKDKVIAMHAIAGALSKFEASNPPSPSPGPSPSPNAPPKPRDCTNCGGVGKVGDGRTMIDCPVCDSDGDGNPEDRIGLEKAQKTSSPNKDEVEKVLDIEWLTSTKMAVEKAKNVNKNILVLLGPFGPDPIWDNLLVKDFVNENFVSLFGDLEDSALHNTWASQSPDKTIVKDGRFVSPVLCLLTQDGRFINIGDSKNEKIFLQYSNEPIELLEQLQTLKEIKL